MVEFPLPVLQIWRSRKRVAIQIKLMNIHVPECKYYCLHLVPKFGDMCDPQNWRLHPTGYRSGIWAVASGASLKFGVQGASTTNWFSRVNGARDNGIRLYTQYHVILDCVISAPHCILLPKPQSLQYYAQYHIILDCVISAPHCILLPKPQSLQYYAQYHVILDCIISAPHCILLPIPQSLHYCTQYHVILDCVISAPHCILLPIPQ